MKQFSTNDFGPRMSCATSKGGGWWYGTYDGCNGGVNLNAPLYVFPSTWNWEDYSHWRADGDEDDKIVTFTMMGLKKKGCLIQQKLI